MGKMFLITMSHDWTAERKIQTYIIHVLLFHKSWYLKSSLIQNICKALTLAKSSWLINHEAITTNFSTYSKKSIRKDNSRQVWLHQRVWNVSILKSIYPQHTRFSVSRNRLKESTNTSIHIMTRTAMQGNNFYHCWHTR